MAFVETIILKREWSVAEINDLTTARLKYFNKFVVRSAQISRLGSIRPLVEALNEKDNPR